MSDNHFIQTSFFFGAPLDGTVPAAGYGSVASLRALGYNPSYNKLNVAAIGCGGQGGSFSTMRRRRRTSTARRKRQTRRSQPGASQQGRQVRRLRDARQGANIDACTIGIADVMHATGSRLHAAVGSTSMSKSR